MRTGVLRWALGSMIVAGFAGSCGGATNKPVTGSESHFLGSCDGDCPGGLECICGVCTKLCAEASECSRLAPGARCVEVDDVGRCPSASPAQSVCDRPCTADEECSGLGAGFSCSASGVCRDAGAGAGGAGFGGGPGASGAAGVAGRGGALAGAGGVAGTGSALAGAAGVAGAGGGGFVRPALCDLPLETGPCRALFSRFGFRDGRCVEFDYGGCDGNENNFETFEECATTCGGVPKAAFECTQDSQCVRVETRPCPCDPMDRNDFVALNPEVQQDLVGSWPEIACAPCPPITRAEMTSANFGARCNAGRCEIFDVRETEYSECTPEVGCELRGGAQCCNDCGVNAGLTALRKGAANDLWVDLGCNELPITCGGGCAETPPTEATAECIDGRCRVVTP